MPDEKISEETEFPYTVTSEAVLGPVSARGSLNVLQSALFMTFLGDLVSSLVELESLT
jgi:hypothetical protein